MGDLFPILAIETSDELCSVALLLNETQYFERNIKAKHVHSAKLVPMIESVLKEASLLVHDLKVVAVSEGPGSFTGLRIGMAAAKGLANGAGISFLSVPTFEALANKIALYLPARTKFYIVKKANKDEYYFGSYIKNKNAVNEDIQLSLLNESDIEKAIKDENFVYGFKPDTSFNININTPSALDIGIWAYKFGKDLLTSDYDLIEPKYLKKFVVKEKK